MHFLPALPALPAYRWPLLNGLDFVAQS